MAAGAQPSCNFVDAPFAAALHKRVRRVINVGDSHRCCWNASFTPARTTLPALVPEVVWAVKKNGIRSATEPACNGARPSVRDTRTELRSRSSLESSVGTGRSPRCDWRQGRRLDESCSFEQRFPAGYKE